MAEDENDEHKEEDEEKEVEAGGGEDHNLDGVDPIDDDLLVLSIEEIEGNNVHRPSTQEELVRRILSEERVGGS